MVTVSISTNFPEVQRALDRLRPEVAEKAAARAVNRTIEQARTQMVRGITAEFAVLSRDVRERLRIRRASFRGGVLGIEAELEAVGRRSVNVMRFGAKQAATGVSVKIRKGGARKILRGTFIANKGRTVFERVDGTTMRSRSKYAGTKHGQTIRPVQTVFVPSMFNTRRINEAVIAAMRARFPVIFEREAAFEVARFNRGKP